MKKSNILVPVCLVFLVVLTYVGAQTAYRSVTVDESGEVVVPTTFFQSNFSGLTNAIGGTNAPTVRSALELGTAATNAATNFATASQGTLADSAVQPTRTISTTAPLSGGGNLSADRTLSISNAATNAVGVIQLATDAEIQTGTDTAKAVRPSGLTAWWTWIRGQAVTFLSNLSVNGNFTAGDAVGDSVTINAGTVTAVNLNSRSNNDVVNVRSLRRLALGQLNSIFLTTETSTAWETLTVAPGAAIFGRNMQSVQLNTANASTFGAVTIRPGNSERGRVGVNPVEIGWGSTDFSTLYLAMTIYTGGSRFSYAKESIAVAFGTHSYYDVTTAGHSQVVETDSPNDINYLIGFSIINGEVRLWAKNGASPSFSSPVLTTLTDAANRGNIGAFMLEANGGTLSLYRNGVLLGSLIGAPAGNVDSAAGIVIGQSSNANASPSTQTEVYVRNISISW